ncbi:GNAT family N-acetyltransferase [Bradyrhizobium sp. STM 3809]|uniref:GNAT family N-acetyltransferase n=1 Tax=Bradyrhizobium sp. STM 3809 TaxID=551936 RepID=UPI00024092D9|nr:GNAT family N-acetyltransferase [Bradyrhizobium sp. STM 3809]CCE00953.1 putative acetyltransferase [Bradyrhizobium sp. STM 3809]
MTKAPFPVLATRRLRLRAIVPNDRERYQDLLSIPDVTRYANIAFAPNEEQTRDMLARMAEMFDAGTGCSWIIEDLASNDFVGAVRFNYFVKHARVGGVGYELHPHYWGRGLMTEALRAVVGTGHALFDLNRIEAWTFPGNGASDRVLQKAGFLLEGVQRQKGCFRGALHDVRLFARLASDAIPPSPGDGI